jgi:uncharacterized membrane-anchored protein YhcB (DUF1043 family)
VLIDINKFKSINKKFNQLDKSKDYFKNRELLNSLVDEFTELTGHINDSCKNLIDLKRKINSLPYE